MVSAVSSINQNQTDTEYLEIIRRLQSLGISPSGNLSADKQKLQQAELQKRQQTLASNSEQNLSKLNGTGNDFSSVLGSFSGNQVQNTSELENTQIVQPVSFVDSMYGLNNAVSKTNLADSNITGVSAEKMTGAMQLAELNKLKLGLTA